MHLHTLFTLIWVKSSISILTIIHKINTFTSRQHIYSLQIKILLIGKENIDIKLKICANSLSLKIIVAVVIVVVVAAVVVLIVVIVLQF